MADIINETLNREEVESEEEEAPEEVARIEAKQTPQEFVLKGIPREKDLYSWQIPEFMAQYLQRYPKEHVPDSEVAAWLEEYPPRQYFFGRCLGPAK